MANREGLKAKRSCNRCTAINKNGDQCERVTCKVGPMCWQHTWIIDHVLVKPSTHGLGLFANKPKGKRAEVVFKKDAFICYYAVGPTTIDNYGEDDILEYGVEVKKVKDRAGVVKKHIYNSYKTNDYPGRYANDCNSNVTNRRTYSDTCNNAKIVIPKTGKNKNTAYLKAVKDIKQGEEIKIAYGKGYWGLD